MKVGTDGVLLGAWADINNARSILDIGTGTGIIALMLAQRTSTDVLIDAVELNAEAAKDASENFLQSPWKERLQLYPLAVQKFMPKNKYDLIISNPPFFANSFKPPDKNRETARHAESLPYNDLLKVTSEWLLPNGRLVMILPPAEGAIITALAKQYLFYCNRRCEFRTRLHKSVERVLLEFSFRNEPVIHSELCLYKSGEDWTEGYHALVKYFYLKG